MEDKDRIATYYSNARELVKQNNPKAARAYVLAILNYAVGTLKTSKSAITRAKTELFLDRWIAVSKDLYDKGITDYVLECFCLPTKAEQNLPKVVKKQQKPKEEKTIPPTADKPVPAQDGGVDISGLIDEAAKTQGWCADVFEKNKSAVVQIFCSNSERGANGTGFIISEHGYLLTNDHVVYDDDNDGYFPKLKMTFAGNKKGYPIQVLFSDKKADIALCSFAKDAVGDFGVIKRIADYSALKQGADCLVIGNAFGMGLAPFTGVVRFTKNDKGNLVYTAPSNPGDSGAPVLDRQGECIGINKSKTTAINNVEAEGYANATPMDKIDELLTKWCSINGIEL